MRHDDCARAESNAGAVALGEASDAEREEYRAHIARCASCLNVFGGERDIERTMQLVSQARDEESWVPHLRLDFDERRGFARRGWQFGLAAAAIVALAFGVRALVPPGNAPALERVAIAGVHRIASPVARQPSAGHDLVVVHSVATLHRPPLGAPAPARMQPRPVVAHRARSAPAVSSHAPAPQASAAPAVVALSDPSQREERSVSALRTVGTSPPAPERAESIAVIAPSGVTRDAAPLGGENAIVPRPPAIAYYENAEGTTAFEVSVDERGTPVKCTIVKSSRFVVLDEAVCRAAMRVRYAPREVNGRAVPGVYRDALTFQAGEER